MRSDVYRLERISAMGLLENWLIDQPSATLTSKVQTARETAILLAICLS